MKTKIDWRLVWELALAAFVMFLLAELLQARQNERALSRALDSHYQKEMLDRYHYAVKGKEKL